LPRGLGDDPLVRKKGRKRGSSRNSTSSGGVTHEFATEHGVVRPLPPDATVAPALSHNDVFFKRRSDRPSRSRETAEQRDAGTGPNGMEDAAKVPEIAEAFDIVRIAEVAQSTQTIKGQDAEHIAAPSAAYASSSPDSPVVAIEPPPQATAEITVAAESMTGGADAPIAAPDAAPPKIEEAVSTASLGTQAEPRNLEQPEPQKKGILGRLFRRFGR